MTKTETAQTQRLQQNMDIAPPAGYPTLTPVEGKMKKKKQRRFRTTQRGDRGFVRGCLAGLCCCFVCEECCC